MFYIGDEKLRQKADTQSEESRPVPELAELPDRELVQQWREGSEDAAGILVDRYSLRLVALVASRLSKGMQRRIDADSVVQSAMGSFFAAALSSTSEKQWHFSDSLSLWNLLATFARRKLSRAIKREKTAKRGVGWQRAAEEQLNLLVSRPAASHDPLTLIRNLDESLAETLTEDQLGLVTDLISGRTQTEIAHSCEVNVRTVRRRINDLRELLSGALETQSRPTISSHAADLLETDISLPKIAYASFVLGKMIGAGSIGKVYRSRMQRDGRLVAVKFMRKRFWQDPVAARSFLREVDRASRIRHSNVLRYFAWGESPHGGLFLVSEFVDGNALTNCRPTETHRCIWLLKQVCSALDAAHMAGVTHGDVTPNNVVVSKSGQVVLTDFGFAKFVSDSDGRLASSSPSCPHGGTLGFAAPEQISPAFGQVGPATDIYAVGGLAHWMLTGKPPHANDDVGGAIEDTVGNGSPRVYQWCDQSLATQQLADVATLALKTAIAERPAKVQILASLLGGRDEQKRKAHLP